MSELVERLKAATGPDRELDWQIDHWALWGPHSEWENAGGGCEKHKTTGERRAFDLWLHITPPVTSSIDAALALAERLLPGWTWVVGNNLGEEDRPSAAVTQPHGEFRDFVAHADTPALAIVLAVLEARATLGEQS